jgi:hypothetical protein
MPKAVVKAKAPKEIRASAVPALMTFFAYFVFEPDGKIIRFTTQSDEGNSGAKPESDFGFAPPVKNY